MHCQEWLAASESGLVDSAMSDMQHSDRNIAEELYELYELETDGWMDIYGFMAFCELMDPCISPAAAKHWYVNEAGAVNGRLGQELFVEWLVTHHLSFIEHWRNTGC